MGLCERWAKAEKEWFELQKRKVEVMKELGKIEAKQKTLLNRIDALKKKMRCSRFNISPYYLSFQRGTL